MDTETEALLYWLAEQSKNKAYASFVRKQPRYQECVESALKSERAYAELDIPEESRKVIDQFLEADQLARDCELVYTYIAGGFAMLDLIRSQMGDAE